VLILFSGRGLRTLKATIHAGFSRILIILLLLLKGRKDKNRNTKKIPERRRGREVENI